MPVTEAVCSTCQTELNARGECLNCLLRVGLDWDVETTSPTGEPSQFGDFQIKHRDDGSPWELGRGGMGVTYRAADQVLNRDVALKVVEIPLGLKNSPALRTRFLREARNAASLHHPNVAEVFQFGTSPKGGQAYYAMQLVDGETLEERVRREGPLPVDTALEIAIQVAHALVAAAGQGLVHRDLKPANIMLSRASLLEALHVTVIDFGLARALAGTDDPARLTDGGFAGTPAFASPEQFRGEPADARSDIYSLGVTLWYALTGRPPFTGHTTEELRDHPDRVNLPVAQLQGRKVSAPVVALLCSTLALDPARRPASARAFLTALEACRRRPSGWLVYAVASAVGILAVAGSLWSLRPERSSAPAAVLDRSIAVLPFDNFSDEKDSAFFADGVQDEVLTDLAKVADLKVISRASVMQYKDAKQRNLREIGKALGVAYVVEGSVQRAGNKIRVVAQLIDARTDAHKWAEKYDRDLQDVFAIQSDIARAIADQLRSNLSPAEKSLIAAPPTTDLEAYKLYTQARAIHVWDNPGGAEASLREKMGLLEQAVRHDPNFALAYCEISKNQDDYEEMAQNRQLLEPARQAAEKALQLQPGLGDAHRELARYYLHARDFSRAHDEAALALHTLPNDAEAHRIVAEAYKGQDRWEHALPEMEKAHELDPGDDEIEYHLTEVYRSMRRYRELEHTLLGNRAVSRLDSSWMQTLLAESKLDQGDLAAARDLMARVPPDFSPTPEVSATRFAVALNLRDYDAAERVIADTSPQWVGDQYLGNSPQTWDNGMLARLRGDEAQARAIFTAAREWTTTAWDDAEKGRAHLWLLARCDATLGRQEDAIREAREVIEQSRLSKYPGIDRWGRWNLALVYALTGERTQAVDELESLSKMCGTVTYGDLRCNPYWDALRGDPRFEALVASLAPQR